VHGISKLAYVETKLFLREKVASITVFALPLTLVVGFGAIPGFGKPQKTLSGQIGTEFIASLGIAIVLATLGLNGVPMVIGQYRERGILRRLGVTPVRPVTLLVAKLAVWAAAAVASVLLLIAVVRLAYHVPVPVRPGWFAVSLLLGIAALFALGMLAAAVAPTGRAAAGIGWVLFFPNMFLAGVYFPSDQMSPTLQRIGDYTPLGAALHAVRDTWMGLDPRSLGMGLLAYLGIMAGYAVVAGLVATRFFRWEQVN
jgi:ABC-2 type transport system permease protein